MKKRLLTALLLVMGICLLAAWPALADAFRFAEKEVTVFEGETWQAELVREGAPAEVGTLTWTSRNTKAATVDQNGVVTGVLKGKATIVAELKIGKRSWKAQVSVKVARRVLNVTLNTEKLAVFAYDDPIIFDLLEEAPEVPVLAVGTGRTIALSAVCTPEDASDVAVLFSSTDAGIARVRGKELRGMQPGECDLTIQSRQNPEITETYHVIVTNPITKLDILAGDKRVAAGDTLQLDVNYTPNTATIQAVEWSSRTPTVATVDENGLVTGLKKGQVIIDAKARDGSGRSAAVTLTVTQTATGLTVKESFAQVITGRTVVLHPEVLPKETNDKTVSWYSSDERIATVQNGQVRGVKAGVCEITCVSNSNPELSVTVPVEVIQQVTKIEFSPKEGISLDVRTSRQLYWTVYPEDATMKDVTFSSSNTRVATVDANGVVTGVSRGSVTITAMAADGSRRTGTVRVNVLQPVEGVSIQYNVYHVQIHRSLNIKALLQPSNANNTRMSWSTEDPHIATVKGTNTTGTVYGQSTGTTFVTGVTEDGGFSASAEIRVADFNGAIMIEDLRVKDNQIMIQLRNMSDFVIDSVRMTAECYDDEGEPMVCNEDGESNSFVIDYIYPLDPGERSDANGFVFRNTPFDALLGAVTVRVIRWTDSQGYTRNITAEEDQPIRTWNDPSVPIETVIHVIQRKSRLVKKF